MYPRLVINIKKLCKNAEIILSLCQKNNISSCFLVTKVLAGNVRITKSLAPLGFSHIADSRITNLKKYKDISLPKVLLRSPTKNEIKNVILYTDVSLESELATIYNLNEEAKQQNKIHKIILMFDLGDLREGILISDDYIKFVNDILKLTNINLWGIGTNLTCYGGIIPTKEHLSQLIKIKENIENFFNISIPIISAGNSSFIYLLDEKIPKQINNLRIGEAIYFGHETSYYQKIASMYQDAFTLEAQLIEVKTKPSLPIGLKGKNAFLEIPQITNQGIMLRGIAAIGRQDVYEKNLFPINKNIKIIGASSDHLILDLTNTNYKLGDIISFRINYPGLLQLMTSKYITKNYYN